MRAGFAFFASFLPPLPGEAASPRFLLSPPFPLDLLALGALGADGFCTRFALACLLLSLTPHALHNVFGPSGPFRHNGVVCVLQCAHRFPATPGNNCPDVDASIACVIVSSRQSLVRIASRRVFFSSYTPFIHHPVPSHRVVASSPRALWFSPSPPGRRDRGGRSDDCRRVSRRARRRDDARDDANDARDTTTRASSHHRASHARVVASTRRPHPPATIARARANSMNSHPRRHRADARASRRHATHVARNTPHVTSALARESPTASRRTSTDGADHRQSP